jgi:hypothetical protein
MMDWKGFGRKQSKSYEDTIAVIVRRTEKYHEKPSAPVEIRNVNIPNRSAELSRDINLLDNW